MPNLKHHTLEHLITHLNKQLYFSILTHTIYYPNLNLVILHTLEHLITHSNKQLYLP